MPGGPPRVAIGLCDGLDGPGRPPLAGLLDRVGRIAPDVPVRVLGDLCRRPELLRGLARHGEAERLVIGVCDPEAATPEFQRWTRKAGLDSFAVELVALPRPAPGSDPAGEADDAAVRLAAAAARLQAFAGSEPEQLRLRLLSDGKVSRRSLFTLPPVAYDAVASVDEERCLGERRCGLCVSACPVAAIQSRDGDVVVDKARCESCGVCVSTCPVGAVGYPGSSLPQYEAEIGVLAAARRGIVFTCRRAGGQEAPSGPGWVPVEVPCLGMVTAGWLLQTLAAGAPALAVRLCGESCRLGCGDAIEDRVDYAWLLLNLLGDGAPSRRATVLGTDTALPALGGLEPLAAAGGQGPTLREPAATAEAVLALADGYGSARDVFLASAGSPLGFVSLREETCTACGACADACPTGALASEETAEASLLSYDPARCIGCRRCVPVCPEGAMDTIGVSSATDLQALARGRVTLKRAELALCQRCGQPIAAAPMLRRVREILEADGTTSEGLVRALGELCPGCRGLATSPR